MKFNISACILVFAAWTYALPALDRRAPHEIGQAAVNGDGQANPNVNTPGADDPPKANDANVNDPKANDPPKRDRENKTKDEKAAKEECEKKKGREKNKENKAAKKEEKAANTAGGRAANATLAETPVAAGNNTAVENNAAAGGDNLQPFKGALAGLAATPVQNSGDAKRPFQVKGDTFVNIGAALQRSCDQQFNACANAANSKAANIAVADCEQQKNQCNAADAGVKA